jgi:serine/threonine protein kinase
MANEGAALPMRAVLNKRYFIGKVLGAGGFGITYKAYDLFTSDTVAVKEFFPRGYARRAMGALNVMIPLEEHRAVYQHWLAAFVKEARVLSTVKNLHGVVKLRNFFQENNSAYIVTDFLEGIPLRAYINNLGGRLELRDALSVLRPVFDSLYVLHENGVIHKDISPENIMVVKHTQVKLIDFGAASLYKNPVDRPYIVLKKGYSPIELYSETAPKVPWTELYQAGVTLFNALTCDLPAEAPERAKLDLLKKPSYYGVKLPPIVEAAIMKSLKVNPKDRYQTMLPFIQTLYGEMIPSFGKTRG